MIENKSVVWASKLHKQLIKAISVRPSVRPVFSHVLWKGGNVKRTIPLTVPATTHPDITQTVILGEQRAACMYSATGTVPFQCVGRVGLMQICSSDCNFCVALHFGFGLLQKMRLDPDRNTKEKGEKSSPDAVLGQTPHSNT